MCSCEIEICHNWLVIYWIKWTPLLPPPKQPHARSPPPPRCLWERKCRCSRTNEREIDERNNLINEESSHVSSGSLASNLVLINGNWAANYVRAHRTLNIVNFVCILKLIFIRLSIRVAFRETSYICVPSWRHNGQVNRTPRRRLKRERERKMAKSDTFLLDTIYVVDPFLCCFVMSIAFRSNKTKQARLENESPSFFFLYL